MTHSCMRVLMSLARQITANRMAIISLLIVLCVEVRWAEAQSRDLLGRLPPSANAVVILNVEKAIKSPLGVQQGWKDRLDKSFAAGLHKVPPKATQYILAADMDFEFMNPVWQVAVVDLSAPPSLDTIAQTYSGERDTIESLQAIVLPNDTTLVQFGPRTLGAMSPANRQAVSRWLRR